MPKAISATNAATTPTRQPPSRIGKKGVTFYLEPIVVKQLRRLSVDEDTSLQALMVEATNLLFKSRGKSELGK